MSTLTVYKKEVSSFTHHSIVPTEHGNVRIIIIALKLNQVSAWTMAIFPHVQTMRHMVGRVSKLQAILSPRCCKPVIFIWNVINFQILFQSILFSSCMCNCVNAPGK